MSEKIERLLTKDDHRRHANKDGFSVWYIRTPRRRKIEVQEYKGRLYIVGMLYQHHTVLLGFEATIGEVRRKFGEITR